MLFIPFGSVVGLTKHLAVVDVGCSATAPGCDVIGIHLTVFPNPGSVGIGATRTQRTV